MKFKQTIWALILFIVLSNVQASDEQLSSFVENLVKQTIVPGIEAFASRATNFKQQTAQYCENPTAETLAELQTSWTKTYLSWKKIQLFGMGPTATLRIERQLDFWPTRVTRIEQVLSSLDINQAFSRAGVSAQGLPAAELLIFKLPEISPTNKCRLLPLLSQDIESKTNELNMTWSEYSATDIMPTFIYSNNPAEEFINALVVGIYAVRKKSLIVPMGLTTGYIDSQRTEAIHSQIPSQTFLTRLESIIALFADDKQGLIPWLKNNGRPQLASKISTKLQYLVDYVQLENLNFLEMIQTKDERLLELESNMNDLQFLIEQDLALEFELIMFFKDLDGD